MDASGWETVAPASQAIVRVARTHKALAGRLLRELGLHPGQDLILAALWARGPQRMTDLTDAVESDAPSLTRSVARLERAGLVARTPSSSDRRVMIVAATRAGLALRAGIEDAWRELESRTAGALTAVQRAEALRGLALLEQALTPAAAVFPEDTPPDADGPPAPVEEQPRVRKDAARNAERLIAAAVRTGLGTDRSVPMAQIAAAAGVGIGTLYRHYPSREALLEAMQVRAYRILIAEAHDAHRWAVSGLDAVGRYLAQTFAHRDELVLPLHGAPLTEGAESSALREQLKGLIGAIVERGHQDGTLRPDVTGWTLVRFGAMLAQPAADFAGWDEAAAEQRTVFLRGIASLPG